ncbi:neuropeptide-like protein 30 [Mytilus californianus]|uniref:neuropeptide-like protein 30 n=1 Tax=Mytilus californianus TaxID=6549 RepID=UPI002245C445|nr:neuropeptide-like protein 30 [Mytilus californianus]XP_052062954.1 neuropeptide-like protein 30 [Mytilus californianus]
MNKFSVTVLLALVLIGLFAVQSDAGYGYDQGYNAPWPYNNGYYGYNGYNGYHGRYGWNKGWNNGPYLGSYSGNKGYLY